MADPDITVIVTNHGRRGFLPFAIESALKQNNVDPEHVEIVVSTNLPDTVPSRLANEKAVKVRVIEATEPIQLADAIAHSRGRILCFLDDDDTFTSDKLAEVERVFSTHPRLGYYSNNFAIIDEAGALRPDQRFRASIRRNRVRVGPVYLSPPGVLDRLKRFPALGPDFNSSSISVRRSILTADRLNLLTQILGGTDTFRFYCALASGCDILIDSRVLTMYRVHLKNLTISSGLARSEALAHLLAHAQRLRSTFNLMSDRLLVNPGDLELAESLRALAAYNEFYAAVRSGSLTRREIFNAARNLIRFRHTYTAHVEPSFLMMVAPCLLVPRIGQEAYYRMHSSQFQ